MTTRSRYLALPLAFALALATVPAVAQSDGDDGSRSMGDIIADAIERLAREVGSAQEDIGDLAPGIDPSDPDAPVDPADPADAPVDPTDPDTPIDPSDPEAPVDPSDPDPLIDPGAPAEPAPEEPGDADQSDGIDLPPPEPDEEGGFSEIQLLPDPVPLAGRWKVVNHPGKMTCTRAGTIPLKRSTQRTSLKVLEGGRTLKGPKLAPGAKKAISLTWQPDSEAYTGVVTVAAPGGRTRITFYLRVVSPKKMKGEMVATTTVNAQGIKETCGGSRGITLTHK